MNQSAAIYTSDENNRLNNFRRVLFICLASVAAGALVILFFEAELLRTLSPYLPMDGGKTPAYYHDLVQLVFYDLIWLAVLILLALYLYSSPSRMNFIERFEAVMGDKPTQFSTIIITSVFAITLFVAFVVLRQFPNSSDEYVYLFQGETLSQGKLYQPGPPVERAFGFNHIATRDGISVGRFPPGWPLMLSIFYSLHLPVALANPVLALLSLILFYRFARRLYGNVVAGWSLLLFSFTGFFIFNSASFFSHSTCVLAVMVFIWCAYLYIERENFLYGLVAGLAMGMLIITRYYSAVLLFIPVGVLLLYRYKLKALTLFVFMAVGSLPFLIYFFWYNYAITGNAFRPVTVWGYSGEGLGFVNGHTFMKAVEHIVRRTLMFIYWCGPVLLILYVYFIIRKFRDKQSRLIVGEDYIFLALVLGYMLYYEIGGNQYGPRFYYEGMPFLVLLVAVKVIQSKKHWAKGLLVAGLLVGMAKVPFIAYREAGIVREREDVYRLVKENRVDNAVVLLTTGTSVTRPMPTGDLTRNDRQFRSDVLYAIDHDSTNNSLMRYYRDRKFYRYTRKPDEARGMLTRIR